MRTARIVLLAAAASAPLTWMEWSKHHPPDLALVAVIHFVAVLAIFLLALLVTRRFRRPRNTNET